MSVIKTLINKIKNLNINEKIHILSILKNHNIDYTKNYNGYFFNLDKIDESLINKLNQCVDLIETNRDIIYSLDRKRDEHLKYYKSLIESKLNETIATKTKNYVQKLIVKSDESFKPYIKKKNKTILKKKDNKIVDPDLLIKEYNTQQKYQKDSVYYRLFQICKISARKIKITTSAENFNHNLTDVQDEGDYTIDNSDDIKDIEETDEPENLEDLDIDPDNLEDLENLDQKETTEEDPEGNGETDNEESDNEEIEIEETNETDNLADKLKIEFYKNLLKINHGFEFDYDKDIRMTREEYIY
jgi:hypothetical protein